MLNQSFCTRYMRRACLLSSRVNQAVSHLDGKHVVFGEVQSGIKALDRMKSVTLLEPKREGKPVPEQRVSPIPPPPFEGEYPRVFCVYVCFDLFYSSVRLLEGCHWFVPFIWAAMCFYYHRAVWYRYTSKVGAFLTRLESQTMFYTKSK